jgi:NADH pyrophosphatase NudC (nudix superfamily)
MALLFSGPVFAAGDTDAITLQRDELTAWRWAAPEEADALLRPAVAARIVEPLQLPGTTAYRETRHERTP